MAGQTEILEIQPDSHPLSSFWVNGRQTFLYKIREELRVARNLTSVTGAPTSHDAEECSKPVEPLRLAAGGSNGPHCVHFQGRWFPAGMGFGRDGNLHVMVE